MKYVTEAIDDEDLAGGKLSTGSPDVIEADDSPSNALAIVKM